MPAEAALPVGVHRQQTLHANVIRACTHCGAPGFWHDTPGVNVGCYAPDKVTKLGSDWVGPTCPNCGHGRPGVEEHGMIWRRLFGPAWALAWARFSSTLRRRKTC